MSQQSDQLIELPIDHTFDILCKLIAAGINVHLDGGSGIGKTTTLKAVADTLSRPLCTRILSAMDVGDIGMAVPDADPRFLSYRVSKMFPFVGTESIWVHPTSGKPPLLFLDEVNDAAKYMMNIFQQAMLEKSIHGVPFIPGTVVVSAGNRAMDGGNPVQITAPFANRSVRINCLPPTLDGYVAYCRKHNVNEWISSYAIHTGGASIYEFDPKRFLIDKAFPTPRAWAEHVGPIMDMDLTAEERIPAVAGAVGRSRGEDFEEFYRFRAELPDFDRIKTTPDGWQSAKVPDNAATKIIVVNSLIRHADHKCIGNLFKYCTRLSHTDPEFNDLFEKGLFTKDPTFAGHPEYTKWVLANNRKPIQNAASVSPTTAPALPIPEPSPIIKRTFRI